jgi:hypothetical protein
VQLDTIVLKDRQLSSLVLLAHIQRQARASARHVRLDTNAVQRRNFLSCAKEEVTVRRGRVLVCRAQKVITVLKGLRYRLSVPQAPIVMLGQMNARYVQLATCVRFEQSCRVLVQVAATVRAVQVNALHVQLATDAPSLRQRQSNALLGHTVARVLQLAVRVKLATIVQSVLIIRSSAKEGRIVSKGLAAAQHVKLEPTVL